MEIIKKLEKIASTRNLVLTDKADRIVKAKAMLFEKDKWIYCPCASEDKTRYCGSSACLKQIQEDGVCHCGLFRRK